MTNASRLTRCPVVCPGGDEAGPEQRCQLRAHDDGAHAARTFVAKHLGDTFLRWVGNALVVGVWPEEPPPLMWAAGMPALEHR